MELTNIPKTVSNPVANKDNKLNSIVNIPKLPIPENPLVWSEPRKDTRFLQKLGYIEMENGEKIHPLALLAGHYSRSRIADLDHERNEQEYWQPAITVGDDHLTLVARGQLNKSINETLVLRYPVRYIGKKNVTEALVTLKPSLYYDPITLELVQIADIDRTYLPNTVVSNHADIIVRAEKSHFRVGTETFYRIGSLAPMTPNDMVDTLRDPNRHEDYLCVPNANGDKMLDAPQHYKTKIIKHFKENLPEVTKVEYECTYNTEQPVSHLLGKEYHLEEPLLKGVKPRVSKPENTDEIVNWFKREKLPEIDSILASAVARGFRVSYRGSKEYLMVLSSVSNFAKTMLIAKPLHMAGLATLYTTADIVGLAGGSTRISGSNARGLAQYPFTVIDEATTADRKVDSEFLDIMKTFTAGMAMRSMNQKSNDNIVGGTAIMLSRIENSTIKTAHDELLNRMVKLDNGSNEEFADAPDTIENCCNAMAHYFYEKFREIHTTLKYLSAKKRTEWCDTNIKFDYEEKRAEDKALAKLYPYKVALSMAVDGARIYLDECTFRPSENKVKPPDMVEVKGRPITVANNGFIVIVKRESIYESMANGGEGLHRGTLDDIVSVIEKLFIRDNRKYQINYNPVFNDSGKAWVKLDIDLEQLYYNTDPQEAIEAMTLEDICEALMLSSEHLTPKLWSSILLRAIDLDIDEPTVIDEAQEPTTPNLWVKGGQNG